PPAAFATYDIRLGADPLWTRGSVFAQSRAGSRSRIADCVGCLRSPAGCLLTGSADAARESGGSDGRHALRIRLRSLYLAEDAGAVDLVRHDWNRGDVCGGVCGELCTCQRGWAGCSGPVGSVIL